MDLTPLEIEDIFDPEMFIDKAYVIKQISVDDLQVKIYALHRASTTDQDLTGQIVWPAAKLLAAYLSAHRELFMNTTSVLELGAGAGLSGLVAATLMKDPSRCILTDNNERVLELLSQNIQCNFFDDQRQPQCCNLSWGAEGAQQFCKAHGDFDLILGADVVFWPSAVPLLFETVLCLLTRRPVAEFILSYVNRSEHSTKLLFEHATRSNLKWRNCDISNLNVPDQLKKDAQLLIFTLICTKDE